jgi:hypothetical protein
METDEQRRARFAEYTGEDVINQPTHVGDRPSAHHCPACRWRKDEMKRQIQRLPDYPAARGNQVVLEVVTTATRLNDERPKR